MRTVVEESLKSFLGEIEKEKETEERAKELAEKLIDALRKAGGEVKMRETEGAYVIEGRMPKEEAIKQIKALLREFDTWEIEVPSAQLYDETFISLKSEGLNQRGW